MKVEGRFGMDPGMKKEKVGSSTAAAK